MYAHLAAWPPSARATSPQIAWLDQTLFRKPAILAADSKWHVPPDSPEIAGKRRNIEKILVISEALAQTTWSLDGGLTSGTAVAEGGHVTARFTT